MGAALKQDEQEFDEVFGKISKLYDHAENILRFAYDETLTDRDKFVAEIEGLVSQIEESANTIAEDFSNIIETGNKPTNAMKMRVTSALRKVLIAIEDYQKLVTTE